MIYLFIFLDRINTKAVMRSETVHLLSLLYFPHPQVGSPSALSDSQLDQELRLSAKQHGNTLYVPSGALWGGQDIQRLNDTGSLKVMSFSYFQENVL